MKQDAQVIAALNAVVAVHGRWGFWKCFDRLRIQGHGFNDLKGIPACYVTFGKTFSRHVTLDSGNY